MLPLYGPAPCEPLQKPIVFVRALALKRSSRLNSAMRLPRSLPNPRQAACLGLCIYLLLSVLLVEAFARDPVVNFIWPYILSLLICAWVQADARARGRHLCYDYESFTFFAWPVLTPIYLFQTRGLRGIFPLLLFLAILAATYIAAYFVSK